MQDVSAEFKKGAALSVVPMDIPSMSYGEWCIPRTPSFSPLEGLRG
jgi:hypothetical protein